MRKSMPASWACSRKLRSTLIGGTAPVVAYAASPPSGAPLTLPSPSGDVGEPVGPGLKLLPGTGGAEDAEVVEAAAYKLQAHGQARLRPAAGDAGRRLSGEIERIRKGRPSQVLRLFARRRVRVVLPHS